MMGFVFTFLKRFLFLFLRAGSAGGSFPPPLSAQKEEKLLIESSNGNLEARNKLIEHNLRLVAHIVKKYYAPDCDPDDLISIGTVGLIKAVSTFKATKGIRLATYASRCIENELLMHFRAKKKTSQDVYISDPIDTDKDGNTLTLMDIIADSSDISEALDTKMKLEKLKVYIYSALDERELSIIEMRYGIGGKQELTQREIAKKLGISRSYVSRIETAALKKLKRKFED